MAFTNEQWAWRFAIAIALDLLDAAIGWIPVVGLIMDIILGFVGRWLWGNIGGLQWVEILEFTNILDMAIPTLTIAGIIKWFLVRREERAKRPAKVDAPDAIDVSSRTVG